MIDNFIELLQTFNAYCLIFLQYLLSSATALILIIQLLLYAYIA